jgi:asparagine synthase (glutamine-hydrolysing)
MGAFFLFESGNQEIDLEAVKSVFDKKGFGVPDVIDLGRMTLWHYRKQLVTDANYVILEDGSRLFSTGSVIYKGRSYCETLRTVLEDFCQGRLNTTALLGNFCLIFHYQGKISMLTDRLCAYHVFTDSNYSRFSSSFLAILSSFVEPKQLNRFAFYEKLSTGYIIGPDTLVNGIQGLTPKLQAEIHSPEFKFISYSTTPVLKPSCKNGFEQCLDQQLETLQHYFESISPLATEYGVDLGLSSGYDSRLLLLLAKRSRFPVSVHTHLTQGVHEMEVAIAETLASKAQTSLRIVQTQKTENHDESALRAMLDDGLYYYDAYTGDNSGAFHQTYTRAYKKRTLGEQRLRLNGEGGEIYRNYYYTSAPRVHFRSWFRNKLFYWFTEEMLGTSDVQSQLEDYILGKISLLMDHPIGTWVDQFTLRRYYGEIHLPYCEGFQTNADNQLAFFLFPFAEFNNLRQAYQAGPYIGVDGKFEAAMIERLDPEIATLPSHYGFPLNHPPVSYWVYSAVRGYVPDSIWYARKRWFYRRRKKKEHSAYLQFAKIHETSAEIRRIEEFMEDVFPNLNLQAAACSYPQQANLLSVGYFLMTFQDKLRFHL